MNKNGMLGWILMVLALLAMIGAMTFGSGCALFRLQKKAKKAIAGIGNQLKPSPDDLDKPKTVAEKVEKSIGFWLGLGAGLAVLSIVGGGILLGHSIISGGSWKKGTALFVGGILVVCGIYSAAIILPWLKWIVFGVLALIAILVVAGIVWVIYQVFVLKRGFFEVVTCFQRKKKTGWNKDAIDFMNKNQTPATRKMVREVKAVLPPAPEPETLKVSTG